MRKETKANNTMDALELLKDDHRNVEKAFEDYEALGPKAYVKKKKLADSICEELKLHTKIEEEIFYPAFRKSAKKSTGLVNEAKVEHDSAANLIKQIQAMDSSEELFDAKVKVLSEHIDHHVKEEEEEIFPAIKKSGIDLAALGQQMQNRKQELR